MKKTYILDTNVLFENEKCIEILRNGDENDIIIPSAVIEELDRLKRDSSKRFQVLRIINEINNHRDWVKFIGDFRSDKRGDNAILEQVLSFDDDRKVFVTNDKIFRLKAESVGLKTEELKMSSINLSESERYSGFVDLYNKQGKKSLSEEKNCFFWDEQKRLKYWKDSSIDPETITISTGYWGIKAWDAYQAAAITMIKDPLLPLVSIESSAGKGKTFISLAGALHLCFQKKMYSKIFIIKSNYEIGKELGFLPGNLEEKTWPIFSPIRNLLLKLHDIRQANKLFQDSSAGNKIFNPKFIEFLPLNFLRGENIDNAIVIVDECQNISRGEIRTILSRCGENTKVICTGDIEQIDNPYLSKDNNALSWMINLFQDDPRYGHILLKGKKSRGPICDLVKDREL